MRMSLNFFGRLKAAITGKSLSRPSRALRVLESRHKSGDAIFVASDCIPLFDRESGGLRLRNIIEVLSSDYVIIFGSLKAEQDFPEILQRSGSRQYYEEYLSQVGVAAYLYGLDEIDTFLETAGARLRLAFVSFPHVGAAVIPLLRLHLPECRIGYDMVDFHALRMRREAEVTSSESLLEQAEAMEGLEIALTRAADVVFAVSDPELSLVRDSVPEVRIFTLPNAFRVPPRQPPGVAGRKNVLFLGGFWHRPNGDAVQWFVQHVWPLIRQGAPDAEFHIAGSNMDESIHSLERHDGVKVIGYVPDLEPFFNEGRVFVAPLRFGAGMKGKVGLSMAYGLPVVTNDIGAEGMNVRNGRELLLANDVEGLAAAVLRLLECDEDWLRIQEQARQFVAQTLSFASLHATLRQAFVTDKDARRHAK